MGGNLKKKITNLFIVFIILSSFCIFLDGPTKVMAGEFTNDKFYQKESETILHKFEINGNPHTVTYEDKTEYEIPETVTMFYGHKLIGSNYFSPQGGYYYVPNIESSAIVKLQYGIWRKMTDKEKGTLANKDTPHDKEGYYYVKVQNDELSKISSEKELLRDYLIHMNSVSTSFAILPWDCSSALDEGKSYPAEAYEQCYFRDGSANFETDIDHLKIDPDKGSIPPTIIIDAKSEWKRPKLEFTYKKVVAANSATDIDQNHFFFQSAQHPNLIIKFINCNMVGLFFAVEDNKWNNVNNFEANKIHQYILKSDMRVTVKDQKIWWDGFINRVYNNPGDGTNYEEKASYPVGTCPEDRFVNVTSKGYSATWEAKTGSTGDACDGEWTSSLGVIMARAFCKLGEGMHNLAETFVTWAGDWLEATIGFNY